MAYFYPSSDDEQPIVRPFKAPQTTGGYASDTGYDDDSGDEAYYHPPSLCPPPIEVNINAFKRFPVELAIKGREKTVVSIPERWFELDEQDVSACDNFGIHTGHKNGITAVDCHSQFGIDMDELRTIAITTPSGKCCYLFEYEESLESIYIASSGISILNDKRCVFFGKGYKKTTHPIVKMPEHVRTALVAMRNKAESKVEVVPRWYDLINILPTDWYDDEDMFVSVIHAFQNYDMPRIYKIKTVQKLLTERYGYYHEPYLIRKFNEPAKSYTFKRLQKMIEELYPQEYVVWQEKYSSRGVQRQNVLTDVIRYKKDALVKFAAVKEAFGRKITSTDLIALDSRFVTIKKMICKSCRNLYRKDCCASYISRGYTSCNFVENVKIV